MAEELLSAVASDEAARTADAKSASLRQLMAEAEARVRAQTNPDKPEMTDEEAINSLSERSNAELERYQASIAPTEEEIAARGQEPATEAIANTGKAIAYSAREVWNRGIGAGSNVVDVPGYLAAGAFDAAHELVNTGIEFDEFLRSYGVGPMQKQGETPDPNAPITPIGGMARMVKPYFEKADPWISDRFDKGHPIRVGAQFLTGFLVTRKIQAGLGLTGMLAKWGKTAADVGKAGPLLSKAAGYAGRVGDDAITSGLAQVWSLAEDDNLYRVLSGFGIPEADARAYFNDEKEDTAFAQRLENGITTAAGAALTQPVFDGALATFRIAFVKGMGLIRKSRQTATTIAAKAAEVGDPSLEATIKAAQEHAATTKKTLIDILGDPDAPFVSKPNAKPDVAGNAPLPPLKSTDKLGVTIDEAMDSVLTRAENPAKAPEPLYPVVNYAKINDEEDILRAVSDFQEGFDAEISQAVGGPQTHASVKATAAELDGFELVKSGLKGDQLSDAAVVELRNFYVVTMRKFLEVAKLHRSVSASGSGTDATRIAGAKLADIVRNTQRIIRRESAAASRRLGVFRIPAQDTGEYELYQGITDLMGDANEIGGLDKLLKTVAKVADEGDMAQASNVLLNSQGLKALGVNLSEGFKSLYYFSLLSRLTTQIRNTVGSPAHFLMQQAEMKAANVGAKLGNSLALRVGGGDPDFIPAVYDGETAARSIGFVRGMSQAFRIPQLVTSAEDIAAGVLSADTKAISAGAQGFASQFDEGVYGAFRQNKSSFGGSSVSHVSRQGPVFGTKPTHLMGYSPDENMFRVLNLFNLGWRGAKGVVSTPGRALNAVDELWKTSFSNAEARMLAYRQAYQEVQAGVLPSANLGQRVEAIAANPANWMKMSGANAAMEGTFTNMPGGKYGQWMQRTKDLPYLGHLVMPFTRAPGNVAWQSLRRTPLAALPAVDTFLADVMGNDARKRDLAWSRYLLGNAAILSAVDFFMDGDYVRIVSGAKPVSVAESQQNRRNLMTPITVQLSKNPDGGFNDGEFVEVPIRGYDPATASLIIAGNLLNFIELNSANEEEMSTEELLSFSASALASVIADNTALSSFVQAMAAISQRRFGEFYENQVLAVATPGAVEQFVPLFDDVYRETFSTWDRILAGTPGMSKTLPIARDAWGFPRQRIKGWAGVFAPVMPRSVDASQQQPVDVWLGERGLAIGEPTKTSAIFRDGVEVPWHKHTKAYEEYKWLSGHKLVDPARDPRVRRQMKAGNMNGPPSSFVASSPLGLVGNLNDLVRGKAHPKTQRHFDRLPDDEARLNYMNQIVSFYRAAAREVILSDPRFGSLQLEVRMKAADRADKTTDVRKARRLRMGFGVEP